MPRMFSHNFKDTDFSLYLKMSALCYASYTEPQLMRHGSPSSPICPLEEHGDSHCQLTPWSTCILQNLIVAQLCKEFPYFKQYEGSSYTWIFHLGKVSLSNAFCKCSIVLFLCVNILRFSAIQFVGITHYNRKSMDIQSIDPWSTLIASLWEIGIITLNFNMCES
jgi:hypothetical protein